MFSKEDALEAAKLAKAIGSQLGAIDRLSTERPDRPANQIDINKFISQVVDPNRKVATNSSGYVPEELVRSMVPEPDYKLPQSNVAPIESNSASIPMVANPSRKDDNKKQVLNNVKENTGSIQIEDKTMKKIANSLERISKAYEKYVDCYVTINSPTNILND
jgi:hypothetical protein